MADITANRYLILGTAAERVAFIPDPVDISSIGPGSFMLPIWLESDTGDLYAWNEDAGPAAWVQITSGAGLGTVTTVSIGFTVDGGGSPIATGTLLGIVRRMPQAGTIIRWTLSTDQNATVELDVFMNDPTVTYPPTTSIVASAPPELTAADFAENTTLTGWTTAVPAGRMFGFEIVANDVAERLTLQIDILIT